MRLRTPSLVSFLVVAVALGAVAVDRPPSTAADAMLEEALAGAGGVLTLSSRDLKRVEAGEPIRVYELPHGVAIGDSGTLGERPSSLYVVPIELGGAEVGAYGLRHHLLWWSVEWLGDARVGQDVLDATDIISDYLGARPDATHLVGTGLGQCVVGGPAGNRAVVFIFHDDETASGVGTGPSGPQLMKPYSEAEAVQLLHE